MSAAPESHLPLTHLSFEILMILAAAPLHGYAAIRALHDSTTCITKPRTGTFYSAIHRLQGSGLVEEVDPTSEEENRDERRRYYGLTARGREVLAAETGRLEALVKAARGTLAARRNPAGVWEIPS